MGVRFITVYSIAAPLVLLAAAVSRGDEAGLAKELSDKGAKLTEAQGVITGVELPDPTKWDDEDFGKVGQLSRVQKLSFGPGLTDHHLSLLSHLPQVTAFTTNGSRLDDDGVRQLARFKDLTVLTFFHPGNQFRGAGLADLSALAKLESLTVGGSSAFGNEGLAAIGKLKHLKSLRVFHCDADVRGLASLKDLKELKSVTVGQRLAYEPPPLLSDDALAVLADLKSLESITLMEARLSLPALSRLRQLPSLSRLTLDGIDLPESDVDGLKAELPRAQVKWTAPTPAATKRIKAMFDSK